VIHAPHWVRVTGANLAVRCASTYHLLRRRLGLASKSPYRVMFRGPRAPKYRVAGFYTARWLMARSAEEAVARAAEIVVSDLGDPSVKAGDLTVEECVVLEGLLRQRGAGFSFWSELDELKGIGGPGNLR
jgi:hypothetical protein